MKRRRRDFYPEYDLSAIVCLVFRRSVKNITVLRLGKLKRFIQKPAKRAMAMKTQINPMRTLVVDDSEDECTLLNVRLRPIHSIKLIGFVHDGIEAIHYLRGFEQFKDRELFPYPDLLLLDFDMPRCNGMHVLRYLQRQFYKPRVILWSNTLERVDVSLAMHLGADLVCRKPTDGRELSEIVDRFERKIFQTGSFLYSSKEPQAEHAEG